MHNDSRARAAGFSASAPRGAQPSSRADPGRRRPHPSRACSARGQPVRIAVEIRESGPARQPEHESAAAGGVEPHAASRHLRHHHPLVAALRTASRRRPRDRSRDAHADHSRHGRPAAGLHGRRAEADAVGLAHPLPRVLRQQRRRMARRLRAETDVQRIHGLTSCSEWTGVPVSTLLRECGVARRRDVGARRRRRRVQARSQHPDRRRCSTMRWSSTRRTASRCAPSRDIRCGCCCPAGRATRT